MHAFFFDVTEPGMLRIFKGGKTYFSARIFNHAHKGWYVLVTVRIPVIFLRCLYISDHLSRLERAL